MNTRTNIVIDEGLIKRAMKLGGIRTKREAVDAALRDFVRARSQKNILDLVGQDLIDPDYDYKRARAGD
jgi:Arc/MetJ family transcription regulator